LEKPGAHTQSASDVLLAGETWPGGQLRMRVPAKPVGDEAIVRSTKSTHCPVTGTLTKPVLHVHDVLAVKDAESGGHT